MTCNYSKRKLENGPVSISCTVITFLTAELLPKLEVLGFKCCRLYVNLRWQILPLPPPPEISRSTGSISTPKMTFDAP